MKKQWGQGERIWARKSGQSTIVVGCPPVLYPKWGYFFVLL